jgi:hypothetical protein
MGKAKSKPQPELDEPDIPAEPPPVAEVEITVGGHTVIVKAAEPLAKVAAQALGLFEQTQLPAATMKFGFDANSSQIELRPQPDLAYRPVEPFGPEED